MLEHLDTGRLGQSLHKLGKSDGEPLVLVHGNGSDSGSMLGLAECLGDEFRLILPDLRGYGHSEQKLIDARRGAGDWIEDLFALLDALGIESCHLLGWSLGGAVAMAAALREPRRLRSVTLLAPVSPFGYGGTCDLHGTANFADFAGSGGGMVNADYANAVAGGRQSENSALVRHVMRHAILGRFDSDNVAVKSGRKSGTPTAKPVAGTGRVHEEDLLDSLYRQHCGKQAWPGDSKVSGNWPGMAPGEWGPMNAISPKYFSAAQLPELDRKPPLLRIQGAGDVIISDASHFDPATLGMLGMIPGWPGLRPQPMVSQMTRLMENYRKRGGIVEDRILPGCGHAPHIQFPQLCARLLRDFIQARKCS